MPITTDSIRLEGAEAHHLLHVMRAEQGTEVVVFDGRGAEYKAKVSRVGRGLVDLHIVQRLDIDRELPLRISLGVALPKGERQRWLTAKAVELGVARMVPLITRHGVAQPTATALDRLRRAVVESSKQCGRNRLTEICSPEPFPAFVGQAPRDAIRLVADPRGDCSWPTIARERLQKAGSVVLAVGPEGGFAEDELTVATTAGWFAVDLGPRILRVETAAIALVALAAFTAGHDLDSA
ncbi:MAG: RsmE family RNA methyltransferase [Planctomycetales bacterium]|nr:RsmE family RNA methyltransferase [Planctomycetales bacterium]NIM07682.1 RsmE family RNA methyltransferase [Planctomycetales bacterium]NIN07185.1 RsmE family RNA methyltransferase [Planctomycetales bacterium]NIO33484.1 RsmE family RNA methyltransferase [Planctomycetales bacterium]NIO45305.1 RsmE family RNA methyltransferase [Planctomycetales bacterium]